MEDYAGNQGCDARGPFLKSGATLGRIDSGIGVRQHRTANVEAPTNTIGNGVDSALHTARTILDIAYNIEAAIDGPSPAVAGNTKEASPQALQHRVETLAAVLEQVLNTLARVNNRLN